ncbi:MAG: nucleoside-diphosphate sugar epimerase/dehydratase [Bacillota bacterium]|jgi:FlaA1/EpsC-like NDP-sugar epimerase|nr:nucleoside-diphosphate sugar epimerase/dehydratase [Bacillota bacterium]HHU43875.1 polysaccharide biosynthesis protein [Clostridiales bacterium]
MKIKNIITRYSLFFSLLLDAGMGVLAFVAAYWTNRTLLLFAQEPSLKVMWIYFAICIVITIMWVYILKGYKTEWRYAGITELFNIIIAFVASGIMAILIRLIPFFSKKVFFATIVLFYYYYFCFIMLLRLSARFYLVLKKRFRVLGSNNENIIIYGAGYTGAALVKRLLDKPEEGYDPVAIIDDDPKKHKKFVSDIPIIGGRDCLNYAIRKYKATTIAIAISKITRDELISIYTYIKKFNIKIKVASNMSGADAVLKTDVISLKNLRIEDLLHRKEHKIDRDLLDEFIKDKVIMVTGGAGSIGSEICRQALYYHCKHLIIYDHHEYGMFKINEELKKTYTSEIYSMEIGSVRDKDKVKKVIERYKPNVVFHAAAYKHVPMMEISSDEAVKNNVIGTENVINECIANGVKKFILVSTDKAINPANIMGATKRIAELVLQCKAGTSSTQLAAVRFGNVLGSSGSVIPTFMNQINNREPVTVTHPEMKRYFMTIPEAVKLVIQAGALAEGGEVFVLDMGEPVYIKDLAIDLIRASGLIPEKDIKIEYTGLRPGEKLFEELQYSDEDVDKTRHSGIFVCKLGKVDCEKFEKDLQELKEYTAKNDKIAVEKKIFEIVPSLYREKNNIAK